MIPLIFVLMMQPRTDTTIAIIRNNNQKLVWNQDDYPSVRYFELTIDGGKPINLGKSSIRIGTRVESTIPTMSRGRHTLTLRACNEGGCSGESNELRVSYRIGAQ